MLIGIIILCALLYLSLLGFKTMYALIALANMPVNRETGVKRFRVQGEAASTGGDYHPPALTQW
jgi:hypothetical protein